MRFDKEGEGCKLGKIKNAFCAPSLSLSLDRKISSGEDILRYKLDSIKVFFFFSTAFKRRKTIRVVLAVDTVMD